MESLVASVPLRNEPVQARSTARLTALLDSAAAVVDEIGFERLTTALVADRAGASIGTVYRYFPERIAILRALGVRNFERLIGQLTSAAADAQHKNWGEAVEAALDVLVSAFRSERSFRSLRVGDVIDVRPAENDRTFNSLVAEAMLSAVAPRFGMSRDAQTQLAFEHAYEVADALAARAFAFSGEGDPAFLAAAVRTAKAVLVEHCGEPA